MDDNPVPVLFVGSATSEERITNPVLKIWGLENDNDNIFIINELVEIQLDKIIESIYIIAEYRNNTIKISKEELREYLRKPVLQQMIDLDLL